MLLPVGPFSQQERENFIYYWWWKYVRANKEYFRCHENGGAGEHRHLYTDFGDVYGPGFDEWWEHHRYLFTPLEETLDEVKDEDTALRAFHGGILLLTVNEAAPIEKLNKAFNELVKTKRTKLVAGTHDNSTAEYPVARRPGRQLVKALNLGFQACDLRQYSKDPLWRICERLELWEPNNATWGADKNENDKKRVQTIIARRYIKRAAQMIKNTLLGVFPTDAVNPEPNWKLKKKLEGTWP